MGSMSALMPKMKSKSGAKKRFKVTGTGKFKRSQKGKRHILTKKSQKRKRQLRGTTMVHETQEHQIRAMMPHA
jgi:large subunit ribosomal protein L35